MILRLALLSSHHHSQMNFTWEVMEQAKNNLAKISDWLENLKNYSNKNKEAGQEVDVKKYQKDFEAAMDDDLNTPLALSVLYELVTETNKLIAKNDLSNEAKEKILSLWKKMNKVFGLNIAVSDDIPKKIEKLAEKRKTARENKDFAASDSLRKEIESLGYTIEDLKDNEYKIKRK
jgi:cysteinyl-tRNA synthetase